MKGLKKVGIDGGRLRHEYVSAAEGARYAEAVDAFTSFLTELGPLELDAQQRRRLRELKLRSTAKSRGALTGA